MPKQKNHKKLNLGLRALALLLVVVLVAGLAAAAHADQFDEQIKALQSQNNANQKSVDNLVAQAGSYQAAIDQLQAQIDGLQAALTSNIAKQADIQQQITDNQNKINQQKQYLSDDIRTMYVDGQLSTIEELATSKNLSEYVDKEEYRTSVQNKINATIAEITDLQNQLQKQKSELDVLVNSEKQQNDQLAVARSQQEQLLAYNQDQQNSYNQQISANSSKITELRREQIAANARFTGGGFSGGGSCGGGYPGVWCNAPQDSIIDSWGMYNRECVSYTAFKVAQSGRYMPYWGGSGNANQWPGNAQAAGIPVDGNPRPGDVAISMRGFYGHAMYVESVNGNGTINISQYNASLNGLYSTNTISASGLLFIHF